MPGSTFQSLRDSESFRELVRNLRIGIYVMNTQGEILDANAALLEMFGLRSVEDLQSFSAHELLDLDDFIRKPDLVSSDRSIREFDLRVKGSEGQVRRVLDIAYTRLDIRSGEVLYHGILIDITEGKRLENVTLLQELDFRDPLTGTYNRSYLVEYERRAAQDDHSWSCILAYIDHFKQYNERYGYEAGEGALRRLSRFLMRYARAEDAVVRTGENEFLLLLPNNEVATAQKVAKRLRIAALGQAPVAFSLGCASRQNGESLERTILRSNQNLEVVRVLERTPKIRK